MRFVTVISIASLLLLQWGCENKEKKFYQIVGNLNASIQKGSSSSVDKDLSDFSLFIDKNKIYEDGSFLSEAGISETVSFINCAEDYNKTLKNKNKEEDEFKRWDTNLKEMKNPLKRQALPDPEKVYDSIEQRLEKITENIRTIEVALNSRKIKCDGTYSKLVSIHKK